ncbi:MAG: hypothetical protein OJF62_003358 [Pseudolabrys sp.]|jgi:hypothetical protein|nr:hypothetical protein [Pseudolabrys sp.]
MVPGQTKAQFGKEKGPHRYVPVLWPGRRSPPLARNPARKRVAPLQLNEEIDQPDSI